MNKHTRNLIAETIAAWESELAELSQVAAHLAARIDAYEGERGPELNRLVGRFVDAKWRCDRLRANLARVKK